MKRRDKITGRIALAVLIPLLILITGAWILALWPWPQVTAAGTPTIVGSSKVPQGGIVTWQRQEVCVPSGTTRVLRYAEQLDERDSRLQVEFDIPGFTLIASERVCFNPSITPVLLPNYIGPGRWKIRIETVTDHPGPGDTRSVSFGPEFTVVPPAL